MSFPTPLTKVFTKFKFSLQHSTDQAAAFPPGILSAVQTEVDLFDMAEKVVGGVPVGGVPVGGVLVGGALVGGAPSLPSK